MGCRKPMGLSNITCPVDARWSSSSSVPSVLASTRSICRHSNNAVPQGGQLQLSECLWSDSCITQTPLSPAHHQMCAGKWKHKELHWKSNYLSPSSQPFISSMLKTQDKFTTADYSPASCWILPRYVSGNVNRRGWHLLTSASGCWFIAQRHCLSLGGCRKKWGSFWSQIHQ